MTTSTQTMPNFLLLSQSFKNMKKCWPMFAVSKKHISGTMVLHKIICFQSFFSIHSTWTTIACPFLLGGKYVQPHVFSFWQFFRVKSAVKTDTLTWKSKIVGVWNNKNYSQQWLIRLNFWGTVHLKLRSGIKRKT